MSGWIGVDFDGTLAVHRSGDSILHCGEPVPAMLLKVREWLKLGIEVRIVTARVSTEDQSTDELAYQHRILRAWCVKHFGHALRVTASKGFGMLELWDDRAVQVERNAGRTATEATAERIAAWIERGGDDRARAIANGIRIRTWGR